MGKRIWAEHPVRNLWKSCPNCWLYYRAEKFESVCQDHFFKMWFLGQPLQLCSCAPFHFVNKSCRNTRIELCAHVLTLQQTTGDDSITSARVFNVSGRHSSTGQPLELFKGSPQHVGKKWISVISDSMETLAKISDFANKTSHQLSKCKREKKAAKASNISVEQISIHLLNCISSLRSQVHWSLSQPTSGGT